MMLPMDRDTFSPTLRWSAWTGIVLLAVAIRFVGLDHCPAGFFCDEAEKGYNAWALATSGGIVEFPLRASTANQESRGVVFRKWPTHIEVLGVITSAVYQYGSIPFVSVFGLSVASSRMAAAMAGVLCVAFAGILLLRIWPHSHALGAMLWLAVCPWHYLFSRWALQGIFVPLLMLIVVAGATGIECERRWGWPLTGIGLGLVYYAYSGAQPFALLWGAAIMLAYRREFASHLREVAVGVALFALIAGPTIFITFFAGGAERLSTVALWNAPDATPLLNAQRFVLGYLAHLNPWFLFFKSDSLLRHGIPGFGQLLATDLVFLPLGLWTMYTRKYPCSRVLLTAFLCGPIGAAITWEHIPHSLRAIPMVLPAAIWGGVGLVRLAEIVSQKSRAVSMLILIVCLGFSGFVFARYWAIQSDGARQDYESGFTASWPAAFERAVEEQAKTKGRIWVNGLIPLGPYYAMMYGKIPPERATQEGLEKFGYIFFNPRLGPREMLLQQMGTQDVLLDLDANAVAQLYRADGSAINPTKTF